MLDYGTRGKEPKSIAKKWAVIVHANYSYTEPELSEKTEKVLLSLKKRDDKALQENTETYLRLGYRPLEAMYHGARVTALMTE